MIRHPSRVLYRIALRPTEESTPSPSTAAAAEGCGLRGYVTACFIGTDVTGHTALPNGRASSSTGRRLSEAILTRKET